MLRHTRSLKVSSTSYLVGAETRQPCSTVIGVSWNINNMFCGCHRARDDSLGKGDLSLIILSAWKTSPGVPSLQPRPQLFCTMGSLFCTIGLGVQSDRCPRSAYLRYRIPVKPPSPVFAVYTAFQWWCTPYTDITRAAGVSTLLQMRGKLSRVSIIHSFHIQAYGLVIADVLRRGLRRWPTYKASDLGAEQLSAWTRVVPDAIGATRVPGKMATTLTLWCRIKRSWCRITAAFSRLGSRRLTSCSVSFTSYFAFGALLVESSTLQTRRSLRTLDST